MGRKLRLLAGLLALAITAATADYTAEITTWRQEIETRLKSEDGWLTVAGLFWLEPGEATFGSAETNQVVLPAPVSASAGTLKFDGSRVQMTPAPGVAIAVNGVPVRGSIGLKSDADGPADVVQMGDVSFLVIRRGERTGIRVKDKNSRYRREFTRRQWFAVDPQYRVEARYTPYPAPIRRRTATVLENVVEDLNAVGMLDFKLRGKALRLEAFQSGSQYYIVFRDKTAPKFTYGAARFLYAAAAVDGKTILDFNKAYNPPCAFNPYTTCPLPTKQNIMDIAVEAGELKYDH